MFMGYDATFAQMASSRTEINSMLSSWLVPAIGLLMFLCFAVLLLINMDGLRGKNGASQEEAWLNVGKGMLFVVLGIASLTFVASKISSMNFTI
jgi:hypothetical protein